MTFSGELYINGKDAWETWNVKIIDNSYNNILLPANPKPYVENTNRSEDGTRVYIFNPRVEQRSFQVTFGITCFSPSEFLEKYNAFIEELQKGWIVFAVKSVDTTYKLLLSDYISLNYTGSGLSAKLIVNLREPNPKERQPFTTQVRIFNYVFNNIFA